MQTRSLILSPHEIRAALDGTMGLVVRPVLRPKTVPADYIHEPALISEPGMTWWRNPEFGRVGASQRCPLGVPGDRLRCKETWGEVVKASTTGGGDIVENGRVVYRETSPNAQVDPCWRSPATMPAWASRITLEVVGVRCVKAKELTEDDAKAWGMTGDCPVGHIPSYQAGPYAYHLAQVWEERYGPRYPWETSWAWAVEVRGIK